MWIPAGFIQTPTKLRKPSKSYPELKTWQVIEGQIGKEPEKREESRGHRKSSGMIEREIDPVWEIMCKKCGEAIPGATMLPAARIGDPDRPSDLYHTQCEPTAPS